MTEEAVQNPSKKSLTSWGRLAELKWRSFNLVTHKDMKWFLSIPAQSLDWRLAVPLLEDNFSLIPALRKYEDITLNIHTTLTSDVDFQSLNYSKRIQFLHITSCLSFKAPILPCLIELILEAMEDADSVAYLEVDLTNLVYSLSLKKIVIDIDWCEDFRIPKQLKERGVIIENDYELDLIEIDVDISALNEINAEDEIISNHYDEDEETVYRYKENDDDDEYESNRSNDDEDGSEEDDDEDEN